MIAFQIPVSDDLNRQSGIESAVKRYQINHFANCTLPLYLCIWYHIFRGFHIFNSFAALHK